MTGEELLNQYAGRVRINPGKCIVDNERYIVNPIPTNRLLEVISERGNQVALILPED